MLNSDDIIIALGTPLGEGALAVVRLSGRGSWQLVDRVFTHKKDGRGLLERESHKMILGYIVDRTGRKIDEVLVCPMRAPKTYTREDMVEIHCHGGIMAVRLVLNLLLSMGARLAEPGEFTRRAFINGRIDLAQAEAVLDMIRARSRIGAEQALRQMEGGLSEVIKAVRSKIKELLAQLEAEIDFPEDVDVTGREQLYDRIEEIKKQLDGYIRSAEVGRIYREGLSLVLVGKPNVGKSTLLNRLLGENRAIVTEIPGTTRDVIEEELVIRDLPVRLVDTAGIRREAGAIEEIGIELTREKVKNADLVLAVFDASGELEIDDEEVIKLIKDKKAIAVLNKIDQLRQDHLDEIRMRLSGRALVMISAKSGQGIDELLDCIAKTVVDEGISGESVMISRERHKKIMEEARVMISAAGRAVIEGMPEECLAVDVWEAWKKLGEILGEAQVDEVIDSIFSEFCIGK